MLTETNLLLQQAIAQGGGRGGGRERGRGVVGGVLNLDAVAAALPPVHAQPNNLEGVAAPPPSKASSASMRNSASTQQEVYQEPDSSDSGTGPG